MNFTILRDWFMTSPTAGGAGTTRRLRGQLLAPMAKYTYQVTFNTDLLLNRISMIKKFRKNP